ncbi:MAG: metalloprotease-like protein [Friedmanniella sp.]|nr:metalloprotease-like protein [Friedmanniella sp.]
MIRSDGIPATPVAGPPAAYARRVPPPPPGPYEPFRSPGPRPPFRPRTATLVLAVAAGLVLVLVLSVGAVAVFRMGRTGSAPGADAPAPRAPLPSASVLPTRSGTTAPTPSRSSAPASSTSLSTAPSPRTTPRAAPNRSLTRNSLYRVDLGGRRVSCAVTVRRPKPALRDSRLAPYLRTLTGCLDKTFTGPLSRAGFSPSSPKVVSYAKKVKTPCGSYDQRHSPAYYCSGTRTIYWPATVDDGNEAYTFARLGYVGLAAHEYGHHLQYESGMIQGYGALYYASTSAAARDLLSRRLELQAQCLEGVFLNQVSRTVGLASADRAQLRVWHSYTGDEDPPAGRRPDHGTSAAQVRWLLRGLDSGDIGRCNTWSAGKAAVR